MPALGASARSPCRRVSTSSRRWYGRVATATSQDVPSMGRNRTPGCEKYHCADAACRLGSPVDATAAGIAEGERTETLSPVSQWPADAANPASATGSQLVPWKSASARYGALAQRESERTTARRTARKTVTRSRPSTGPRCWTTASSTRPVSSARCWSRTSARSPTPAGDGRLRNPRSTRPAARRAVNAVLDGCRDSIRTEPSRPDGQVDRIVAGVGSRATPIGQGGAGPATVGMVARPGLLRLLDRAPWVIVSRRPRGAGRRCCRGPGSARRAWANAPGR